MTYRGRVLNGVVLLPSAPLPEGAPVRIASPVAPRRKKRRRLIMRHAGTARGLPHDASKNLDHYLYGHPKQ